MRNAIFFSIVLFFPLEFLASNYPTPANGAVYGFVDPEIGGKRGYSSYFTFKSNIEVNGKTYQSWQGENIITRNDSNKVFIYDWGTKKEQLLYDFNLMKGDTFVMGSSKNSIFSSKNNFLSFFKRHSIECSTIKSSPILFLHYLLTDSLCVFRVY